MSKRLCIFMLGLAVFSFLIVTKSYAQKAWQEHFVTSAEIVKNPTRVAITINFETGKAKISPQHHKQLVQLADAILKLPQLSFEIGGHTDPRGDADFNQRLSERRAESIKSYLTKAFGIRADRLLSRGYGESQLITPEYGDVAWAKNRRVEVVALATTSALPILKLNPIGHTGRISDVKFSPDNTVLYTAGIDGTIQSWNFKQGKRLAVFRGETARAGTVYSTLAVSPDGSLIAAAGKFPGTHPAKKYGIRIFDTKSQRLVRLLQGPRSPIMSLLYSSNGKTLLAASGSFLYFWASKTFEFIGRHKFDAGQVTKISFSPDRNTLIAGTRNGGVLSLSVVNKKFVPKHLYTHPAAITSIDWHPDGKLFGSVSLDGTMILYQHPSQKKVMEVKPKEALERMSGLAFSKKDNGAYTVSTEHGITKYRLSENHSSQRKPDARKSFLLLDISKDENYIATVNEIDNSILIFSSANLSQTTKFGGNSRYIRFLTNGRKPGEILFGESLDRGFLSHDKAKGQSVAFKDFISFEKKGIVVGKINRPVTRVVKRHDIVRGNAKIDISIENFGKPTQRNIIALSRDGKEFGRTSISHIYAGFPGFASIINNGQHLVVSGNGDGRLYGLPGFKLEGSLTHEGGVNFIAKLWDQNLFATSGTEGVIKIFRVPTKEDRAGGFNYKELLLDGQAYLKDLGRQNPTDEDVLNFYQSLGLAIHPDFVNLEPIVSFFTAKNGEWVAWTKSGYYAASPHGDNLIGWHMNRGIDRSADFLPASHFSSKLFRPEVVAKALELRSEAAALRALPMQGGSSTREYVVKHSPPIINIISPRNDSQVATPTTELEFIIEKPNDDVITDIKYLVNGRRVVRAKRGIQVSAASGKEGHEPRRQLRRVRIPLVNGENRVQIIASTRFSESMPAEVRMQRLSGKIKPRLFVLSVGVSDYKAKNIDLKFADDDAIAVADVFRRQRGVMYGAVTVHELKNQEATRSNILTGLDKLGEMAQGDLAIIFLAGHGQTSDRNHFYFLGHDGEFENLRISGIKWSEFKDTLSELPGKVILMIDACHSGAATRERGFRSGQLVWNTDALAREFANVDNGVVILMASQSREFSIESIEWGHGAFTKAFLDAMGGKGDYDNDGVLHLSELTTYIQRTVPKMTAGAQHPVVAKPLTIADFPVAVVPH
jgi:WD40 repeat protein